MSDKLPRVQREVLKAIIELTEEKGAAPHYTAIKEVTNRPRVDQVCQRLIEAGYLEQPHGSGGAYAALKTPDGEPFIFRRLTAQDVADLELVKRLRSEVGRAAS